MPTAPASARLTGVDAARGVALLGLAAVHVTLPTTAAGAPHPLHLVFAGGASALFVTLAGVGLALLSGGPDPVGPARAAVLRRRIARRAGLLFVLGLLGGALDSGIAVILCHYAVLFLLALPLLRVRARGLGVLAGVWLVAGPVLVFALGALGQRVLGREELLTGSRLWVSPAPVHLLDPSLLLADLLLTGYYPVLSWAAFLLLGMAVGRLSLGRPRVGGALLAAGAVAWAATTAAGAAVRAAPGVLGRVAAATDVPEEQLRATLLVGEHRLAWLAPDPLWLAMVTPHGGGPLEMVRAAGWAVAVLGACLLLARRPGTLAATGRLSLTLYLGHLVLLGLLASLGVPFTGVGAVGVLWALFLLGGAALRARGGRGPLEALVGDLSRHGEADAERPRHTVPGPRG